MPATNYSPTGPKIPPWLLAAVAAAVGRLPALGAWWNRDDWGLLARARDLAPDPAVPVRWLSQSAWWQLLQGLDPAGMAAARILLLAAAAAGLCRVAARLGLTPLQQAVAGLVLAASPLGFTPLYWAAGVQDLLAVVFLVWALERWLADQPWPAVALGVMSLASKEVALGLPLLVLLLPRRRRLLPTAALALAAVAAAALALLHFQREALTPYALGGPLAVLRNLGTYGWWLLTPGPIFAARLTVPMGVAGGLLWLLWAAWSWVSWRDGSRLPALCLAGALLALAPVLALQTHVLPYLAFGVEPFGALAIACLVPRRWPLKRTVAAALLLATVAWAFLGMRARLHLRRADGLPADPLVRATAVSYQVARQLPRLPHAGGIVLLQPVAGPAAAAQAERLGENWVIGSPLHAILDGVAGPRVILGGDVPVAWANGLLRTPASALVLVDAGYELKPWGPTPQALFYQVLTDVGRGLFERAQLHLYRAGRLNGETVAFFFDPDLMLVSLDEVLARADEFAATLREPGARELFRNLVGACAKGEP